MDKNTLLQKNNTLINPAGPEGKVSAENHREINVDIIEYAEEIAATLAHSAYLGVVDTTHQPPLTGAWWARVESIGIYTNYKDVNGAEIEVTAADLVGNLVYLDITDGVAKKILKPIDIADGSVTPEKTSFISHGVFPIGKNILNPATMLNLKMVHPGAGYPFDQSWAKSYWYLPIKSNTEYSFSGTYGCAWYDENKVFISYLTPNNHAVSPSNAVFMSVDAPIENEPIVAEGNWYPLQYEPFVGVEGTKIRDLMIDLLNKNGNKITIGDGVTNEIIVNGVRMYYQNQTQGIFFGGGAGGATIPNAQANVAWGTDALSSVTTGGANTAFGHRALKSLTTGWDNTAFGAGALEMFEDGVGNQAMGRLALAKLVNGGHNTGLTDSALERLEGGDDNTAIGYGSGVRIIQGNRNTLYGVYSSGWNGGANASQITNYDDTVAFGAFTLNFNTSGSKNTTGGNYSMYQLTGESNAAWGYFAMYGSNNSNYNACFGNYSGQKLVNGNNNVFVGHEAGGKTGQKTDAVGTTVIGSGAISTRDNEVVIGKATDTHFTICGVTFTKAQLQALKNLV